MNSMHYCNVVSNTSRKKRTYVYTIENDERSTSWHRGYTMQLINLINKHMLFLCLV